MNVLLTGHDAGGTVPPMLALAEALLARGHGVVVQSQPSVRTRAASLGCTFVPFANLPDYAARVAIEDQIELALRGLAGTEIGDEVRATAARHQVDCIVADANLAGLLAAVETLPIPSVVLLHSMCATYSDIWFAEFWPLVAPAVNASRAHYGLGEVEGWPGVFAGHDFQLAVVPSAFEGTVPGSFERVRHFGFLVPTAELVPTEIDFPAGDDPTVLVGLSTTYQAQETLLANIVDALSGLAVRAIVTTSGQVDVSSPAPHVRIVERAPHTTLLRRTDVMVTHAGLGSVANALSAGVPLVCTPLGRDQHLNAQRVSELGAGVTTDASTIASAIQDVLDTPSYRKAAIAMRETSIAEGGAPAAATALEDVCRV